jgi:hypothetical protein
VHVFSGEENFHIFYYFLDGIEKLGLQKEFKLDKQQYCFLAPTSASEERVQVRFGLSGDDYSKSTIYRNMGKDEIDLSALGKHIEIRCS